MTHESSPLRGALKPVLESLLNERKKLDWAIVAIQNLIAAESSESKKDMPRRGRGRPLGSRNQSKPEQSIRLN